MSDAPEKVPGTSMDISAEKRAQLKALFPTMFTETVNDKGEVLEAVDFEKLKAELGTFTDLFESRRERYGMDWPGKKDALRLIQIPSAATLKPSRQESVDFDTTENLFIEGDNLEVLKLLQKSYYGKVKMIYIDPPYNTGKEFIYPDNYSESLETYLEYAGLIDGEGKKFSTNTPNEGRFHTKWLNMMYPRLYLARNLLRDDGVIFISIDDNELSNLTLLMHCIFGEENYRGLISRATGTRMGSGNKKISSEVDYILIYAKTDGFDFYGLEMTDTDLSIYDQSDEKGKYLIRSLRRTGGENRREDRPTMYYSISAPDGTEIYPLAPEGWESRWICSKEKYDELKEEGFIEWRKVKKGSEEKWQVYQKHYLGEALKQVSNNWTDVEGNKKATRDLNELFDGKKIFDHPKPVELLKKVLQIGSAHSDIILDFFAGSATTAHALLDLNKEDVKRRFIMIQLPEPCPDDSEAFKAGYKTIAEIGKERIRRVIKKLNKEQDGKLALGDLSRQDRGFKVLKLDKSNFKPWQELAPEAKPEKIEEQIKLHIDHIEDQATPEDLLFEILIKAGFMPTEKVQTAKLTDLPVFSIADGALLICLADAVTKELINAVAEAEPMQFICLDKAFGGNDQLKANAVQTFNARNMGRDTANQIVFRTV